MNLADLNSDGIINVLDVIQAVNMALGNLEPDYNTADLNQDELVNILDILLLVNIILYYVIIIILSLLLQ